MSDRPKPDRIAALESERQKIADEQKKHANSVAMALLEGYGIEEDDSKVQNLKDLLTDEEKKALADRIGIKSKPPSEPKTPTRPAITRPSPEALRDSRREPTPVPKHLTVRSPPPKMTPPKGGIHFGLEKVPQVLVVSEDSAIVNVMAEVLSEQEMCVWHAKAADAIQRLSEMPSCQLVILDTNYVYTRPIELDRLLSAIRPKLKP